MLTYRLTPVDSINPAGIEEMFKLMELSFVNLDPLRFRRDLAAKTGVILLYDPAETLRGFSTYLVYREPVINSTIIFSGDTVIHRDSWGDPTLFYGFGTLLRQLMEERRGDERIFWFLISKGIRTYGMLPLFFRRYWPSPENWGEDTERAGSGDLKSLVDLLASKRFGSLYDPASGLIAAKEDYLKRDLAGVPDHKQARPHVRFFLEQNPGYIHGTELACLAEISRENIMPRALRFVEAP